MRIGREIAYHGLLHLLGDDDAEFMAVFTHGELANAWPVRRLGRQQGPR